MFPLQDTNQSRTLPIVNWLLIAANVFVFLMEISMNQRELTQFIRTFGIVPARFVAEAGAAQVASIFTSMFLHGGWLHLISNMWALYIFGDNIEDRLGHFTYLVFYLFCGTLAALVQIYSGPGLNQPIVGASGAIAGVLGAYTMLFPQAQIVTLIPVGIIPFFIHVPAYFYLGFWFVTQLMSGWAVVHGTSNLSPAEQHVAFFAHVGGFVVGLLLVRFVQKRDYRQFHADEYWPY